MPILVTVNQAGGSPQEAERFKQLLHARLREAPGFMFHADGPVDGGWRIVNVWESRADFDRWFENEVKPNLRSDQLSAMPTITELANVVIR